MTIIVPNDYHLKAALEDERIACIEESAAASQDIRPLRIGVLNIMPNLEAYEFNLLNPLGRSILQIEPIWIRLESHQYKSTNQDHLSKYYITYKEAMADKKLDGLIVTGAPVGRIPFDQVRYWDEISDILDDARKNIVNTLGICWGGVAMAHHMGIYRTFYPKKLFGVFRSKVLDRKHPVLGHLDDVFDCPQSRFSRIEDEVLEGEQKAGNINLLAHEDKSGYFIFETTDQKFLIHLGHPEYNCGRIVDETLRDREVGSEETLEPENFDVENPVNSWRSNRNEFFRAWLKHLYLENDY
jgi:homoserine O-succinyltransferase